VLSVGNETDGTYDFNFDTDLASFTDATGIELSDDGVTFLPIIASGQTGDAEITVEDALDRPDCTHWRIVGFAGATFVGGAIVNNQSGLVT